MTLRNLCRVLTMSMILVNLSCAEQFSSKNLSSHQAAQIASQLANAKCKSIFDAKPFSASDFKPILNKGRWQWGRLDVSGINGYSAEVSFNPDGSERKVDVYFSYDSKDPIRIRKLNSKQKDTIGLSEIRLMIRKSDAK